MSLQIQTLTKRKARLRMALVGPTGSGKTFTALLFARALTDGKILVIDTERSSAGLYADQFNKDGRVDVVELPDFAPATYVEAIELAAREGYTAIIIDSLSHAWMGKDGALEQVDKIAKRQGGGGNTFGAWREVTPMHNNLVDAMLLAPLHVIACMRAKTEYVVETGSNGKSAPRKVGLAPVQRDGIEYEFDIVADLDFENNLIVTKTRMAELTGLVVNKPKAEVAEKIRAWLESGAEERKVTDPLEAFRLFQLKDDQAGEVKSRLKAHDIKFSDFVLEAWNAGDRGFLALWKRVLARTSGGDGEPGESTTGPTGSSTTPDADEDDEQGNSDSTSAETAPAQVVDATLTADSLKVYRLSPSELRKVHAAAKRMKVDLAEVSRRTANKEFAALMTAIDPEWKASDKAEVAVPA
ncbi:MAG: ATP-binding protein [Fimbriimonadaceae bacterium]|nr:ATP-binding protein [Fimbriimonadaceae bacterium]